MCPDEWESLESLKHGYVLKSLAAVETGSEAKGPGRGGGFGIGENKAAWPGLGAGGMVRSC